MHYLFKISLFILVLNNICVAQNSFSLVIGTSKDESAGDILEKGENGQTFVSITRETNVIKRNETILYILDDDGDTTIWEHEVGNDTLVLFSSILKIGQQYYMAGYCSTFDGDSVSGGCDLLFKLDSDFNIIWKKTYQRPDEVPVMTWRDYNVQQIVMADGNILISKGLSQSAPPKRRTYFIKVSPEGDSVSSFLYSSYLSGRFTSISYNYDSTFLLMHKYSQYIPDCYGGGGALFLDTETLDTIGSICYNGNACRTDFDPDGMLDNEGNTIVAGMNSCYSGPTERDNFLFVRKYDSVFNKIKTVHLTHKDTVIYTWGDNLDINSQGEICVVGSFNWGTGSFYPQTYNQVYIAKLDSDLNLITERYLGNDAAYAVLNMLACEDGGVMVSGKRYDYLTNDYEYDAFIIKTDAGLWVGNPEKNTIKLHSALVYPNPGQNYLNVRTTEDKGLFKLMDLYGNVITEFNTQDLITSIDTSILPKGTYVWTLTMGETVVDRGKWIKL